MTCKNFLFNWKFKFSPTLDEFHEKDLHRFKSDDQWLMDFLDNNDYSMNHTVKQCIEALKWRQAFGVNGKKKNFTLKLKQNSKAGEFSASWAIFIQRHSNGYLRKILRPQSSVSDICEENVRMDYLINSNLYLRGRDVDGKLILMFKSKLHTRGSRAIDDLKRCFIYWIERGMRQSKNEQLTVVFDMMNSGMSNIDMEYTKIIINTFKHYYPNSLNYILVYEMPWIMTGSCNSLRAFKSFAHFPLTFQPHFKSSKSFYRRKPLNVWSSSTQRVCDSTLTTTTCRPHGVDGTIMNLISNPRSVRKTW